MTMVKNISVIYLADLPEVDILILSGLKTFPCFLTEYNPTVRYQVFNLDDI